MAIYTFTDTQMKALADAIRAKDGSTEDLTIEQMTAHIEALTTGPVASGWRECWLEKPGGTTADLFIDTGIPASFEHELSITCRSGVARMSAPFNATDTTGDKNRCGINFLPTSNKLQVYWGSYADTGLTVDRTELDVTNTMVITQNKNGVSIQGFVAGGTETSWGTAYTATGGSPTSTYKLFTYPRNTSIHFGLFRRAVISSDGGYETITIVPEVSNIFTARLKITKHVLDDGAVDVITYVPVPAGFICHVDNEATT